MGRGCLLWPKYGKDDELIHLDSTITSGPDTLRPRYEFLEEMMAVLSSKAKPDSCVVARGLFEDSGIFSWVGPSRHNNDSNSCPEDAE